MQAAFQSEAGSPAQPGQPSCAAACLSLGWLWQGLPASTPCTVDKCTASDAAVHSLQQGAPVAAAASMNSAHCSGERKS